jgi:heat shock protein HtpX
MIGTLALIIGLSTLFFTVILSIAGVSLIILPFIVVVFNIIQWLISPYLIDALYRCKEVSKEENPKLHETVERLSQKSGIKKPKIMLARIPIPNAFAYSSPLAGSRVAVTTELLRTLDYEEVEAVIGHELGHLRHKDVQIMMFVSILPAIFYYIGWSMMISAFYRGGRREDSGSSGLLILGVASIFIYWVLTLFTLYLSRLREYYADRHSAQIVEEGPRKLSEGLAKIVNYSREAKKRHRQANNLNAFKALFIADPDRAESDSLALAAATEFSSDQKLVQEVLKRKVTTLDKIAELFSTHPNIVKRLQTLQKL